MRNLLRTHRELVGGYRDAYPVVIGLSHPANRFDRRFLLDDESASASADAMTPSRSSV
jgi:hypothetical protein